ncbi:MAG: dihydrofolate reductase [Marivirga sp.]|nr:dihydrofolate reductase [Marivirga sp.]
MRKIILSLAVSLDNFIEGPNGEVDWMTFNEETGIALHKFIQEIDTILYGRISYELYGNYTPPENSSDFEKDFYMKTNKMNKYVFSSSRTEFGGTPTVVHSDIQKSMERLKQQSGKNIWLYGGAKLITSFMNLNLIDEIRIAVMPVILGRGKPLFSEINDRVNLKLIKVESSTLGVVGLYYERAT